MPDIISPAATRFQCRHIFTDGRRCLSPGLRNEEFCYYHHTSRRPVQNLNTRRKRMSTFTLPNPEDRSAIQQTIGEVLRRIASNDIDPRRAGLLLYGCQIASLNLPRTDTPTPPAKTEAQIDELTVDPTLGHLAPRTEFSEHGPAKSTLAQLLQKLEDEERERDPAAPPAPESFLPSLQPVENLFADGEPGEYSSLTVDAVFEDSLAYASRTTGRSESAPHVEVRKNL